MLSDKEIQQLCHGRIIKASVYNSAGSDAAGPHYAVILDSDEQIQEHDSFFAAVISHNDEIDAEFIMPMPAHTGLDGFIVCSWLTEVHLAGITEIGAKLFLPEMIKVLSLIRAQAVAKSARTSKRKSKRS